MERRNRMIFPHPMVHWQPESGRGLPETSSLGTPGTETGWYFRKPDTGSRHIPALVIRPPLDKFLATFQDLLTCLGNKPLDVVAQSTHNPNSEPQRYRRNSMNPRHMKRLFHEHRDLLLKDPSTSIIVIRPRPLHTVELMQDKLICIIGRERRRFKRVCSRHGIRPSVALQILLHVRSSIHFSMEYAEEFRHFVEAMEAESVPREEDGLYPPL